MAKSEGELLQFPCRSCGAKLTYDPGTADLVCGYCGFTEAVPQTDGEVVEHAFEDYKPDAPSGWGVELKRWRCEQCGSETEVEPHIKAQRCAFCGSDKVEPQTESKNQHQPESLLPFEVGQEEVIQRFRTWVKGLWFRPNALKAQARPDRLRGAYLPFWTYDSLCKSFWTAESGTHYYETDDEGNRRRKTRWRRVSGQHNGFFDDVLVPGTSSVDEGLLRAIEPFPTDRLVPYSSSYLSGMVAEDYRRDMLEGWPVAKGRIDGTIRAEVIRQIPGDTHRFLNIDTSYLNRSYKLCLLPIWIATYRFRNTPYTYIVNGQSGKVSGTAPWSWVKLTVAAVCAAAAAYGLYALAQ